MSIDLHLTDREAMILQESLWPIIENLKTDPDAVFDTDIMNQQHVTPSEQVAILDDVFGRLNHPQAPVVDRLIQLRQHAQDYSLYHYRLGICQTENEVCLLLRQHGLTLRQPQRDQLWQTLELDLDDAEYEGIELEPINDQHPYYSVSLIAHTGTVIDDWIAPAQFYYHEQLLMLDRYPDQPGRAYLGIDFKHATYGTWEPEKHLYRAQFVLPDELLGQFNDVMESVSDHKVFHFVDDWAIVNTEAILQY